MIDYNLSGAENVLILAPHPDDEALGCSGSITLLNNKGAHSTIVYLTNGERLYGEPSKDIAEKRTEEAKKSSKMLGCKEALFLDFPDGETSKHKDKIYEKLYEIIIGKRPDLVFAPSPIDFHADHISLSDVAIRLHKDLQDFKLALYEVYSTIRFTHLIDISDVLEQKKQAIMNYRVSLSEKPEVYVHASLGLNAQRSIFTLKKGYYEAFYVVETGYDMEKVLGYLCYKDLQSEHF